MPFVKVAADPGIRNPISFVSDGDTLNHVTYSKNEFNCRTGSVARLRQLESK